MLVAPAIGVGASLRPDVKRLMPVHELKKSRILQLVSRS